MDRADLERLDRDALIALAEEAGVTRARILTRPELVDELLLRSEADQATKRRSRGLFGRARDLLASVVERGLHLPDAADRIRTMGIGASPTPLGRPGAPAALPTVTLAEIYAAQGHRERALETLEHVLARESDHAAAKALLAQLRDESFPVPAPRMPPEEEPPAAARFTTEPGEPDACVAIPVDSSSLFVWWRISVDTLEAADPVEHRRFVLRALTVVPTWDGPRSSVRDYEVREVTDGGELTIHGLPSAAVVRVAIGYVQGGAFQPLAHSPALQVADGTGSASASLARWTPAGIRPVTSDDADAAAIERAFARLRSGAGQTTSNG